jgi:hypothetical protein
MQNSPIQGETLYTLSREPMTRIELVTSYLPSKRSTTELHRRKKLFKKIRAGDEIRTRDPQLGRLTLYQLSYSRLFKLNVE